MKSYKLLIVYERTYRASKNSENANEIIHFTVHVYLNTSSTVLHKQKEIFILQTIYRSLRITSYGGNTAYT